MKRLVVCFDGTWKNADSGAAETNVQRIARAVRARGDGHTSQLTLYLRGVGSTGIALQRLLGGITGEGVDDNIRSAYMFLAQNYVPADEIYVFGFSRGAFTARSLCGFIGCTGLLKRRHLDRLPQAWDYYRRTEPRSARHFCDISGADCHFDVGIHFLGVWDTVGALGVPVGILGELTAPSYQFHDTELGAAVRRAYHALAIDEHRDEFVPTFWTGRKPPESRVEQVWFAGSHSDVGGGAADTRLSDIPLRWMADKAIEAGLVLDDEVLPKSDALDPLAPQHDSRQGWSRKDRLTPTYRRVCEADISVSFGERLYVPQEDGRVLWTVNESIHPCVWERYGRKIEIRGPEVCEQAVYEPPTLAPLHGP
jgi:uncharacterized protein (DUF2235 family)